MHKTYFMKNYLFILVCCLITNVSAQQQKFSVKYLGQFHKGNFTTDLEFDIQKTNDTYLVTFNSLSQNAFGIPAGDIHVKSDTLQFALQSDFYRYDFQCHPFGQTQMDALLTVDGDTYSFDLKKAKSTVDIVSKSRDIRFKSNGLYLYGTIYYPEKPNGKAIYLVTSSGNQDRSASRAEAILFSRAGYITFHTDKRGTGLSDGNWLIASIPELCEDDLNALEFLHQTEHIEFHDIGIKGSSQGATKVPYILQKNQDLGFGIVVSCPASSLLESDLNYWKNRHADKISNQNINNASNMQKSVFQYISGTLSKISLEEQIEANTSEPWFPFIWIPDLDSVETDKKLSYSPLPYFKDLTTSLLVMEGSEDQVIPAGSLEKIKKIMGRQANGKSKFITLQGADHSMMLTAGSDFPYWSSLHPDYIDQMLHWLQKR